MSATPGANPVDQRNDDLLFTITQQTGQGIDGLLNAMFGFLQRRTDFFYQMEPGDKMGFPPGVAESMVRFLKIIFVKRSTLISRSIRISTSRDFLRSQIQRSAGRSTESNRSRNRPMHLHKLKRNLRPRCQCLQESKLKKKLRDPQRQHPKKKKK